VYLIRTLGSRGSPVLTLNSRKYSPLSRSHSLLFSSVTMSASTPTSAVHDSLTVGKQVGIPLLSHGVESVVLHEGATASGNGGHSDEAHRFNAEDSPSYEVLLQHNMLSMQYRVADETHLEVVPPNSTRLWNLMSGLLCAPLRCCFMSNFEVPNGTIKLAEDGRGNYAFYGAGVHQVNDPWYTFQSDSVSYASGDITHGDRAIVVVPQGFIGYCCDRGQPVLLPPGMHQWRSNTLKFERLIDLNLHVIPLGPWTLLTIDEGYMAVTQDNGRQIILNGGEVHLLTHRNWKFEKFVSTKIQTNDLTRNEAASADNVIMLVDATVLWRICDVETAVRCSAETMRADGSATKQGDDITKLRNDVLKQAEASLAFFVGTINFSDTMAAAARCQRTEGEGQASPPPPTAKAVFGASESKAEGDAVPTATESETFNLYNNDKLRNAVAHANDITHTYGVEIISINIISAIPKDKTLQASLAAGAVAAAEAQMMETAAKGKARAVEIEASATAKQTMIVAQADADADVLRAEGSKQAADLLATNAVSVELAKIERTGDAIAGRGNHASFFFGAQPDQFSHLLGNGSVIAGAHEVSARGNNASRSLGERASSVPGAQDMAERR